MQEKQWLVDRLAERLGKPEGQDAATILAFARRYLGLSVKQMAEALGVDKSAVSNYEYRIVEPSYRYLTQVGKLIDERRSNARPRTDQV